MDGMEHSKAGEESKHFATSHRVDRIDEESLYEKLAWPVAEQMLQMLASSSKAPCGFRPADFVKKSFEDTFTTRHEQKECSSTKLLTTPGNSIVDAALGAMGYNASTIYNRKISILVNILTSLVQSKSSCGSYLWSSPYPPGACQGQRTSQGDEERFFCEQTIATSELLQMVENCIPFLVSGKAKGTQVLQVVDALVRVAVNTSLFTPRSEACHAMYRKVVCASEGQGRNCPAWALQPLVNYALHEKDSLYLKLQPCSRLCIWRLQPVSLKQDLSCLARESMERLLLPLSKELCERAEWATLIVCLALAPDVFVEAHRLLHMWFMSSGAMRLWELRAEMVAAVGNVLNGPSAWGFAEEVYLPPQHAFFCSSLRPFILILRWAPTLNGLEKLVNLLGHAENAMQSSGEGSTSANPLLSPAGSVANREEDVPCDSRHFRHDSIWALLMDFLPWLHFASRKVFRRQGCQQNTCKEVPGTVATQEDPVGTAFHIDGDARLPIPEVAARYISWVMNPLHSIVQRSDDEQVILQLRYSWNKVMEAVCIDSSPGICVEGEDPFFKCCRCGVSVCQVKRQKYETSGRTSDESVVVCWQRSSMASLDLWLSDLQTKLSCIDQKQKTVMTSFLALAALAEALPYCTLHFMARLLQFVCHGCNRVLSDDQKDSGCQDPDTKPEFPVCNSGCSVVHCENCCPSESVRLSRFNRIQGHDVDGLGDGKYTAWVPGAAAMFNFLDSIHDGDDDFFSPVNAQSESETRVAKSKICTNLAVCVAEFAKEWSTFDTHMPTGVFLKGPGVESHLATLEDMRNRFCSWIGKLQLSPEVVRICDGARDALDVRIANFRSLLISS